MTHKNRVPEGAPAAYVIIFAVIALLGALVWWLI